MKYFRYLIALFFVFLFSQNVSDSEWRKLIDARTYDTWVNPDNPNTIICGGHGRRIYRSLDGGVNWDTLVINFSNATTQMNNVLIHPNDTSVWIVGGLNFGSVRRTTNMGETWEIALAKESGATVDLNGKAMWLHPTHPDTMYIGDFREGIIFRSPDRGYTWDSISTVYHWSQELDGEDTIDIWEPMELASIAIRPDSTNIMFAASVCSEVFMSEDGGITWEIQDTLTDPDIFRCDSEITRFMFSPRDPMVGYAVITFIFETNFNNGGLHKTTDGGRTWNEIAFKDTSMWAVGCRQFFDNDEVWIGGYTESFWEEGDLFVPGVGIVRRSIDGGETWTKYDDRLDWWLEDPRYRPRANVWSIRYFGEPGREKAYLSSEAGLFVGDFPVPVYEKEESETGTLKITQVDETTIFINYEFARPNSGGDLKLVIMNSVGKIAYETKLNSTGSNEYRNYVRIPDLAPGAYAVRLFAGGESATAMQILK